MGRKNNFAAYKLTDEEKKNMLKEIESFYLDVRDESIGIIGCQQILDFFLEILGNQIYNKALDDVQLWYRKMQDNLESDFYTMYRE